MSGANCKELAAQPDVDGFLVGGASLKVMTLSLHFLFLCFFFAPPLVSLSLLLSLSQPEFIDIIKAAEVKKSA